MKKKEYPQNLLSQVFVNGLPTDLPDDVTLVLEYIIQKILTEREGRVLDMRYKRYMTMAAINDILAFADDWMDRIEEQGYQNIKIPLDKLNVVQYNITEQRSRRAYEK